MHDVVGRLRNRDDTEHEQILIRIGISVIISLILGVVLLFGDPSSYMIACSGLAVFLTLCACGLLAHLVWKPAVNPVRRFLAMLLDIVCLSTGMILGGELMTPLYPLFLWVIFGMGFRYGQRYLLITATMSLLGFGIVVSVSEYWRGQPLLAGSLLLALLILPAYASTLLRKLTEALEKAEESNRAKNRFLATMSHELRTPLNAIFGMSDLLEADRLNANQRDMIATVRSAGRTLLELIDDLLDVARIEAGRADPRAERFDLHETLAVVQRLLRHQAAAKGLELRASYDPELPAAVIGVERWLKQILINLIGNAIKFTNEGEIVLDVRVEHVEGDRADIVFSVADTGIGIAKQAQERIFERFSQADESTNRRYGGSGLGLSIARQLAEIMGGTLTVESDIGEGAHFRLRLTCETTADGPRELSGRIAIVGETERGEDFASRLKAMGADTAVIAHPSDVFGYLAHSGEARAVLVLDDGPSSTASALSERLQSWFLDDSLNQVLVRPAGSQQSETADDQAANYLSVLTVDASDDLLFNVMHAALAVPSLRSHARTNDVGDGGRRILVAEDNVVNQKVIRKMLLAGGHSIDLVDNGEDLLDRLEEATFDLVFVDLNMPQMSGIEAVKLHRMGVGTNHPPFVALTADATDKTREECAEIGFADYLTKPLEMRHFLDVVDRLSSNVGTAGDYAATKVIHHPRFADSRTSIDIAHLRNLRMLDPDPAFLNEIVEDFIDDARGLIDELEAAVDAVDDAAFRDRNHALHSSAAHIGATGIGRLCQQWRHVGPDELRAEGAARIAQIRREFQRLCIDLRALFRDDGAGKEGSG